MKKLLPALLWLLSGAPAAARPLTVTCDRACQVAWRRLEGDTTWQSAPSSDGRRFSLDLPFEEVEVTGQDSRQWFVLWSDTQRVGTTRAVVQLQLQRTVRSERILLLLVLLGVIPAGSLVTARWLQERNSRQRLQETLAESSHEILSGRGLHLGGYVLGERVGRGGMGVVYRASRAADGLEAAVKLIHVDQGDEIFRARFQRECTVASRLNHPGLVQVYDYGEHESLLYLIMEWIEGSTLRPLLRPQGLPLERALPWMEALVDAVAYCHQHHVVHCDLKPENLMIDSRNRLKVLDFGLARDPNLTRLTPVGSVLGTPTYLAPERYREPESKPEASVDQYALGVIFYEMLAGHTPFFSRDVGDLGRLHMQGAVPPLIQQRPDLPHSLCTMIHRMLGKSPAERYPDLDSVRPILQTIRDQPVEEEATVDLSSPKE